MSQMKLDLISIGEQLPPEFMSSFINRLSPNTYLRLRRTCSFMNELAEAAVEKKKIWVVAKNMIIQLNIFEPGDLYAQYCYKFENKRLDFKIKDPSSILGFHYNEVYLRYYSSSDMSVAEIEELDDYMKQFLRGIRCDTLYLNDFPDPDSLLKFLPTLNPLDLVIYNLEKDDTPLLPELNSLKEPAIQKIAHLSVKHCKLSHRFNLLDLCHERQTLKLWLTESWEDCQPMISQFLQDVYNKGDIGILERFTVATIMPPSWRRDDPDWEVLSPSLLGNLSFIVLKPTSCRVEYADYCSSVIYYCETSTKRLLLSGRTTGVCGTSFIRFDLHIIPLDDYSTFIEHLADSVYRPLQNGCQFCEPGAYPIDNSHLYSLLENVDSEQYPSIMEEYIANLNLHMDMDWKEYYERRNHDYETSAYVSWKLYLSRADSESESSENPANIRGAVRDLGRRALAAVSFLLGCCRRLNCFKM